MKNEESSVRNEESSVKNEESSVKNEESIVRNEESVLLPKISFTSFTVGDIVLFMPTGPM